MSRIQTFVVGALIAAGGSGFYYASTAFESILSSEVAPFDYAAMVRYGGLFFVAVGGILAVSAVAGGVYARHRQEASGSMEQERARQNHRPRDEPVREERKRR